jgi:DNA-binding NtrC family response regulator
MNRGAVAICDDEMLIRLWLETHLSEAGYSVTSYAAGEELMAGVRECHPDVVLLDLRLPDGSGLDYLARLRELDSTIAVIMITAFGEVETAVQAVRGGAHHFLEKPIELSELLLLIEQALDRVRLAGEVERNRRAHAWRFRDVTLVGRSNAMREIVTVINRLAVRGSPANVLIRGESGTGKDVVARAIHARGPRADRPFIQVNCTALPETLVESELFGHEKGAFTDARQAKTGLFELAHGGTIFLDEVGDMPTGAQGKLLQVLERRQLRRVGGVRDIDVDAHVIAATNRDLEVAVKAGSSLPRCVNEGRTSRRSPFISSTSSAPIYGSIHAFPIRRLYGRWRRTTGPGTRVRCEMSSSGSSSSTMATRSSWSSCRRRSRERRPPPCPSPPTFSCPRRESTSTGWRGR